MLITREFTNAEVADLLEQLPRVGLPQAGIVAEAVKRLRAAALASQAAEPASETAAGAAYNPWRESLENCIEGSNYLRASEYRQLIDELDRLYAAAPPAGISPAVKTAVLDMGNAGALLSNCAFNLAQRKGGEIDQRTAETLDECRKGWDAAWSNLRAALSQGDVSGEGEG